jgi:hypothetical protein
MMKKVLYLYLLAVAMPSYAEETVCYESRKGSSELTQEEVAPGLPNVKCSDETGAVLWWGDPFDGTQPLGEAGVKDDAPLGEAVSKPREPKLALLSVCGTACHNGTFPPKNDDKSPRQLMMHQDVVPDSLDLQHGRGGIWCLDCHHNEQRNKLTDNFGSPVSFNEPQKVCGKCHGPVYRDWRDGLHGKRIGEWASDGKKRWWVCTECHNPHDVQQGMRDSGFSQIVPEPAPLLPKGLDNADHERHADH